MEMELETFRAEKSYKECLLRENLMLRQHLLTFQAKMNELKMSFSPVTAATIKIHQQLQSITELCIPDNVGALDQQQKTQRAIVNNGNRIQLQPVIVDKYTQRIMQKTTGECSVYLIEENGPKTTTKNGEERHSTGQRVNAPRRLNNSTNNAVASNGMGQQQSERVSSHQLINLTNDAVSLPIKIGQQQHGQSRSHSKENLIDAIYPVVVIERLVMPNESAKQETTSSTGSKVKPVAALSKPTSNGIPSKKLPVALQAKTTAGAVLSKATPNGLPTKTAPNRVASQVVSSSKPRPAIIRPTLPKMIKTIEPVTSTRSDGGKRRGQPPGSPVYDSHSNELQKSILSHSNMAKVKPAASKAVTPKEIVKRKLFADVSPDDNKSNASSDVDILKIDMCSISPMSLSSNDSNTRYLRQRKDVNHNVTMMFDSMILANKKRRASEDMQKSLAKKAKMAATRKSAPQKANKYH